MNINVFLALIVTPCIALAAEAPIDRHALVTRHNIQWNDLRGQVPLGNGEFCFNADGTGLQTFGGNSLSHWAWHSAPLPTGFSPTDVSPTGTVEQGRIKGPMHKAAARAELDGWMFRNPHPMNLARLRFTRPAGVELKPNEIHNFSREYDLWTAMHTSRFQVDGEPVTVVTCVHPDLDLVAVHAESPLLREGKLMVVIDFPYPSVDSRSPWAGDWKLEAAHTSELIIREVQGYAEIHRIVDTSCYDVRVTGPRAADSSDGRKGRSETTSSCWRAERPT